MTGREWHWIQVVSFNPKKGLVDLTAGIQDLSIVLEVATQIFHLFTGTSDLVVNAAIHQREF